MTMTLSTSIDNDLYVEKDGNIAIVYDVESVSQTCEHSVKTRLNEVFINTSIGIPYFETVFVGSPNLSSYEAAIRIAILSVPDVVGINSLSLTLQDNKLSYVIEIITNFGTGVIGATIL